MDVKRPTLSCDLRLVVCSQSAVCRLPVNMDCRDAPNDVGSVSRDESSDIEDVCGEPSYSARCREREKRNSGNWRPPGVATEVCDLMCRGPGATLHDLIRRLQGRFVPCNVLFYANTSN